MGNVSFLIDVAIINSTSNDFIRGGNEIFYKYNWMFNLLGAMKKPWDVMRRPGSSLELNGQIELVELLYKNRPHSWHFRGYWSHASTLLSLSSGLISVNACVRCLHGKSLKGIYINSSLGITLPLAYIWFLLTGCTETLRNASSNLSKQNKIIKYGLLFFWLRGWRSPQIA